MASIINAGTTTLTPIQITGDTSGILQLQTNGGTTAVTIDTSQRVGIGTASPSYLLDISSGAVGASNLRIATTTASYGANLILQGTTTSKNWSVSSSFTNAGDLAFVPSTTNGGVTFTTAAMTLDNSGNLLVGITSNNWGSGQVGSIQAGPSSNSAGYNKYVIASNPYSNSVSGIPNFVVNNASTYSWGIGSNSASNDNILRIGTVTNNSSGVYWQGGYANIYAGTYTNASDYRIKENVVNYADGALLKVLALRPVNYNIITPPAPEGKSEPVIRTEVGFLAHEIQEHIPEVVIGTKDAVNSDGSENHQAVDYAKFTAVLTKAIQELSAQVTTLQSQVVALTPKA